MLYTDTVPRGAVVIQSCAGKVNFSLSPRVSNTVRVPKDACTLPSEAGLDKDKLVLAARGGCTFLDKAEAVLAGSAGGAWHSVYNSFLFL